MQGGTDAPSPRPPGAVVGLSPPAAAAAACRLLRPHLAPHVSDLAPQSTASGPSRSSPTTLSTLPADLLGEILVRVPRPGPASLALRAVSGLLADAAFCLRHRQRHPRARRPPLGESGGSGHVAMAAMAAWAVAMRDRARHQAAGVEWAPPAGAAAPSLRVRFVRAE